MLQNLPYLESFCHGRWGPHEVQLHWRKAENECIWNKALHALWRKAPRMEPKASFPWPGTWRRSSAFAWTENHPPWGPWKPSKSAPCRSCRAWRPSVARGSPLARSVLAPPRASPLHPRGVRLRYALATETGAGGGFGWVPTLEAAAVAGRRKTWGYAMATETAEMGAEGGFRRVPTVEAAVAGGRKTWGAN